MAENMKKYLFILSFFILLTGTASGQGHIMTRKYRLSDFTDKITKVVLSGNEMSDGAFRQSVMDRWTLSPFEFCTAADFKKLMKSADYYFLVVSEGKDGEGDGAGIRFLSLYKGGAAELNDLMLVISIPVGNTAGVTGRELVFMPAFVDIVQDYTREAMEKEVNGYTSLTRYNANYRKDGKIKRICFAEGDIAPAVNEPFREKNMDADMMILPSDEADKNLLDGTFNTLVSYTVFPETPENGSVGYLMLIEADTHSLYYYRKQKVSRTETAGFLPSDIKTLGRGRK